MSQMKLYRFKSNNTRYNTTIYSSYERIKHAQQKYEMRKNMEIEELIVVRINKEPNTFA